MRYIECKNNDHAYPCSVSRHLRVPVQTERVFSRVGKFAVPHPAEAFRNPTTSANSFTLHCDHPPQQVSEYVRVLTDRAVTRPVNR